MKRLFYVRHGETEMNAAQLLSGLIETPLTENGRTQATQLGKEIRANLPGIDLILCSPLERAYETAKLIAEEINYPASKIQKNTLFVERTYGVLEGTSNTHFMKPGNYHELDAVEGSETIEKLQERAVKAFSYICQLDDYDNILVVAHNAFGRALKRAIKNQPHTHEYKAFEQIPNATVLELV
ncbi:MAG TPA: histidine phosphatase family protein [Verrucomicrobiae bacterium]|nr:histidine phosphatase family protein [Verrucomicrobiae bacterium]